jgi:hypothetical protein
MIDPFVLGVGKRVFGDDGVLRRLRLVEHTGDDGQAGVLSSPA